MTTLHWVLIAIGAGGVGYVARWAQTSGLLNQAKTDLATLQADIKAIKAKLGI